jgi:hypothetical protein
MSEWSGDSTAVLEEDRGISRKQWSQYPEDPTEWNLIGGFSKAETTLILD